MQHILYYISEVFHQSTRYVTQKDSQARIEVETCCSDIVLGFYKRFSHATGSYMYPCQITLNLLYMLCEFVNSRPTIKEHKSKDKVNSVA